jgi:uncharacterized protein (TIGR03067 family)
MTTLTVLTVAVLLGAQNPADKAATEELNRLAGTWQVVPLEGSEGNKDAQAAAKKMKITIDGDKYTVFSEGKVTQEGTLRIDPSKTPKTLDMTVTKGGGKGRVVECIYQLDKDTLRLCTALTGKGRPDKFASTPDSAVTKLTREKKE